MNKILINGKELEYDEVFEYGCYPMMYRDYYKNGVLVYQDSYVDDGYDSTHDYDDFDTEVEYCS